MARTARSTARRSAALLTAMVAGCSLASASASASSGPSRVGTIPLGFGAHSAAGLTDFSDLAITLGDSSKPTTSSDISTASDGTTTIAWIEKRAPFDYSLKVERLDPKGFVSLEKTLVASASSIDSLSTCTTPSGATTIVWNTPVGPTDVRVVAQRISSRGGASSQVTVSPRGFNSGYAKTGCAADGTTVIAWKSTIPTGAVTEWNQVARLDTRNRVSAPINLTAKITGIGFLDPPEIGTAADGSSLVTWQRLAESAWRAETARIDSRWRKSPTLNLTPSGHTAGKAMVATSANGRSLVATTTYVSAGNYMQLVPFDSKGARGRTIELARGAVGEKASIAAAPDGSFSLFWAWYQPPNMAITGLRVSSAGRISPLTTIAKDSPSGGYETATSLSPAGVTTVIWKGYVSSHEVIKAARIDSVGRVTSPVTLSSSTYSSRYPGIVTAKNGKSTVKWDEDLTLPHVTVVRLG